jgi:hypothetical protein
VIDNISRLLQTLLAPTIGIVTVYIAWQQWNGNRLKLRLERYERRLRLYEEVTSFMMGLLRDADLKMEHFAEFDSNMAEADFLFGPEIRIYISEIRKRALKLWQSNREYRDVTQPIPEGYNHTAVISEKAQQMFWLNDQVFAHQVPQEMFARYLNLQDTDFLMNSKQARIVRNFMFGIAGMTLLSAGIFVLIDYKFSTQGLVRGHYLQMLLVVTGALIFTLIFIAIGIFIHLRDEVSARQ